MSRIYGCSDIDWDSSELSNTYVSMEEGCLYVAAIKDPFACEVVGRAFGERMTNELVVRALEKPSQRAAPQQGLFIIRVAVRRSAEGRKFSTFRLSRR